LNHFKFLKRPNKAQTKRYLCCLISVEAHLLLEVCKSISYRPGARNGQLPCTS
jgi:hypothetical protein